MPAPPRYRCCECVHAARSSEKPCRTACRARADYAYTRRVRLLWRALQGAEALDRFGSLLLQSRAAIDCLLHRATKINAKKFAFVAGRALCIGEINRLLACGVAGVPYQPIVEAAAMQHPFGIGQARDLFSCRANDDNW